MINGAESRRSQIRRVHAKMRCEMQGFVAFNARGSVQRGRVSGVAGAECLVMMMSRAREWGWPPIGVPERW